MRSERSGTATRGREIGMKRMGKNKMMGRWRIAWDSRSMRVITTEKAIWGIHDFYVGILLSFGRLHIALYE
jgi:hypothetical protein